MVLEKLEGMFGKIGSEEKKQKTDAVLPINPKVIKYTARNSKPEQADIERLAKKVHNITINLYPILDNQNLTRADDDDPGRKETEFLYLIDETDEIMVLGGARGIFENIADRLDMTKPETEAILLAHKSAANLNGYGRHLVMDDVMIVPKTDEPDLERMSSVDEEETNKQLESFLETQQNGYDIPQSNELLQDLDIDGIKYFGLDYEAFTDKIGIFLDPNKKSTVYHAILDRERGVRITREIGEYFAVGERELEWGVKNGKITAALKSIVGSNQLNNIVKTKTERNEEELNAIIPTLHLKKIGLDEGDYGSIFLDSHTGDLSIVVTGETDNNFKEVEIQKLGKGTEKLYAEIPKELSDIVGLYPDEVIEWGKVGDHLVGKRRVS